MTASVYFLDAGQGDATLVCTDTASLMIDCSPVGVRTYTGLVRSGHLPAATAVLITHNDADHINGIASVVSGALRRVYVNTAKVVSAASGSAAGLRGVLRGLLELRDQYGFEVQSCLAGESFTEGSIGWRALWPTHLGVLDSQARGVANAASVALVLSVGDCSVLFCGDLPGTILSTILKDPDAVSADVVLVPHHGALGADSRGFDACTFIAQLQCARIFVVSCGQGNQHGHPHPDVRAALDDLDAEWYCTAPAVLSVDDKGGTVFVDCSSGAAAVVQPWPS